MRAAVSASLLLRRRTRSGACADETAGIVPEGEPDRVAAGYRFDPIVSKNSASTRFPVLARFRRAVVRATCPGFVSARVPDTPLTLGSACSGCTRSMPPRRVGRAPGQEPAVARGRPDSAILRPRDHGAATTDRSRDECFTWTVFRRRPGRRSQRARSGTPLARSRARSPRSGGKRRGGW